MITRTLSSTLMLIAGLSLCCQAEDKNLGTPHITVTGTAITEIEPDQLNWMLEVKHTDLDLAKAAEQHSKQVATVLEIIKKLGVPAKDVQTARMEFGENMVYRDNNMVKEGYFADSIITFKLSDLTKYNELWLALSTQSKVSVQSVSYDHSKRLEYKIETRNKALLNAKEKATAMATTLGAKIGETLSIIENATQAEASLYGANSVSPLPWNRSAVAGAARDSIAPGTIPIRIEVEITFRLINVDK